MHTVLLLFCLFFVAIAKQSRTLSVLKQRITNEKLKTGDPSPITGVIYDEVPKVQDTDSIFNHVEGLPVEFSSGAILERLTQFDHNPVTHFDRDRCGPTVVIAAAINRGLPSLIHLVQYVKQEIIDSTNAAFNDATKQSQLSHLTNMITHLGGSVGHPFSASSTVTYGDLGVFGEIIIERWGTEDGSSYTTAGVVIQHLLVHGAEIPQMSTEQMHMGPNSFVSFANGDGWFYGIRTPGSTVNTLNHWIYFGSSADRSFVYDPQPLAGHSQIQYFTENAPPGDSFTAYTNYLFNDAVANSHQGSQGWPDAPGSVFSGQFVH